MRCEILDWSGMNKCWNNLNGNRFLKRTTCLRHKMQLPSKTCVPSFRPNWHWGD